MYFLEDLEAWKISREFRKKISLLAKSLPLEEKFKLSDQLIRASRSVTANIAEGFGRFHYQENIQFCRQARGSLLETLDHLYVALDEEYLTINHFSEYKKDLLTCIKVLNGYIYYLQTRKKSSRT
jgi:four helix bundle protein